MPAAYYGVRGGPSAGVYNTWEEASAASQGVAGALCKKFRSREDAEAHAAELMELVKSLFEDLASKNRTFSNIFENFQGRGAILILPELLGLRNTE